jgi:hypothetical protein
MEGLKRFSDSVLFPMMDILDASAGDTPKIDLNDIEKILDRLMTLIVQSHRMTQKAHEELEMMAHADEEVGEIFKASEFAMTKKIVAFLEKNDIKLENPIEKIHIIYGLVENYCHETVYHHHEELNNEVMRTEVIEIIKNIKGLVESPRACKIPAKLLYIMTPDTPKKYILKYSVDSPITSKGVPIAFKIKGLISTPTNVKNNEETKPTKTLL